MSLPSHVDKSAARKPLGARAERGRRPSSQSSPAAMRKELGQLWDRYIHESTIHGLVYAFSANSTKKQRAVWFAALLVAAGLACWLCLASAFGPRADGVQSVISDPHMPPHDLPFPAVSLCPLNKVRRVRAEELLFDYLGIPPPSANASLRSEINAFLRAMAFLELPDFSNSRPSFVIASDLLVHLRGLNLTDFMLKVMPTCDQLFSACFWHGFEEDCCQLLHLQQSELGFCFSFNSLTAFRSRDCGQEVSVGPGAEASECWLRRASGLGAASALQVYLRELPIDDIIVYRRSRGLVVSVHPQHTLPSPSSGYLLQAGTKLFLGVAIEIHVTVSNEGVLLLPVSRRMCLRDGEAPSWLLRSYAVTTCNLECKLEYIIKQCGCLPYQFARPDHPACDTTQLMCMTGLDVIRLSLPPLGFPEDGGRRRGLNCSRCMPTCQVVSYGIDTKISYPANNPLITNAGALDIFIDFNSPPMLYEFAPLHNFVERCSIVGGVVGLWLGVSIVSMVETVYYLLKMAGVVAVHAFHLALARGQELCRRLAGRAPWRPPTAPHSQSQEPVQEIIQHL